MEEVEIYQHCILRDVATLHSRVSVMVQDQDREERDNAVNCYPLHPLGDAADPQHKFDA